MSVSVRTLPVPEVRLRTWDETSVSTWRSLSERAERLTVTAGTGRHFESVLAEARRLLLSGDTEGVAARIRDRRFSRAIATVWHESDDVARATFVAPVLRLYEDANPSRLTTVLLCSLLLKYFDTLDRWEPGLFTVATKVVSHAVDGQTHRNSNDVVETFRAAPSTFLDRRGPAELARTLLARRQDVYDWLLEHRLAGFADSRFGRTARDEYYLTAIRSADPSADNTEILEPVTREVLLRQSTETTDEDRLYFGHRVLTELTDHDTLRPSSSWVKAMLDIAGDPRQRQKAQWKTWWSAIPQVNLERAVRWVGGLDLRAFLDGIESFADDKGYEAMQRMFTRRKRLLEGLYDQGLVRDVRLILGDEIRMWVARSSTVDLIDAMRLEDKLMSATAIIYLDCGDFHIVEGTHNFKLNIFIGAAPEGLADRSRRWIQAAHIREDLPARHRANHGSRRHFSVTHHGFEWVRKSLDYLRVNGIRVDERSLMDANDYADLARRRAKW